MSLSSRYVIVLALCAAAVVAVAGCGEEDAELLPGSTANEITANLDTVKQLADEGDCLGAEGAAQQVSEQIEAVEGIDSRLKQALREGAARLNEVVDKCDEEAAEPVTPVEPSPETEEKPEKPEKAKEKEKKPKEDKEEPEEAEGEEPAPTTPGPPEETPPAVPPGQEGKEAPSGGVGPGSTVGEEG